MSYIFEMNTRLQTPIASFGLDQAMVQTLDSLMSDEQKNNFVLTAASDELICIYQLKTNADIASLKEYRKKYPDRLVLAIFKNSVKGKNIIGLRSPVTSEQLLNALTQAVKQSGLDQPPTGGSSDRLKMSAGVLTDNKVKPEIISENKDRNFNLSRPDYDLNNPEEDVKFRYSEERFLQGRLSSAYLKGRVNNSNIQIYTPHGVFQYYPRVHKAHIELNRHSLRNLASVPDSVTAIMTEFDDEDSPKENNRKKLVCADALLWDLTIWASRGRLPIQVDLNQSFTLKNWPNFTRWTITPHAMQITVLWLSHSLTLRNTVAVMGIPQHHIFTFYSAALALDMIELDEGIGQSGNKEEIMQKPSRFKGFIGKLLDYITPENGEGGE